MECFFLKETAAPEMYPLPRPDALPIWGGTAAPPPQQPRAPADGGRPADGERAAAQRVRRLPPERRRQLRLAVPRGAAPVDRKSTRLNSSHANISYAVFCLKKTPPPRPP